MRHNNAKAFGSALSRLRKERGFSSAHQFYKSVGGSKSLGLAFTSYWDIERGKKLPKSWRLKAIMAALGIDNRSTEAQDLVRAYFRALSGSDELLQILSAPVSAGADLPSRELAEAAAQQALSQLGVNLTLEQWKLRSRDIFTNICQNFLTNTPGWVTVRELSDATGFKPEAVRRALKALASGGLIDLSGDKARSRFVKQIVRPLPFTPAAAEIRTALVRHWETWLAGSIRVETTRMTVRMTKANLDIYRQHLAKAVNLASIYKDVGGDRQDSTVYFIDAAIFQIFPRK